MKYVNPPGKSPQNVTHRTFYSQLFNHELGYNIYLPPDYEAGGDIYPVAYFLHGWTGNESSDIWAAEKLYTSRRAIAVFPNNSPVIEDCDALPVEQMLINELIPHIDGEYRTEATHEGRSISGFSMGGGMAFMYAVNHPELFSSVTAYAGTFHHYYHKGSCTVGEPPEKAAELYEAMVREERYLKEGNILYWVHKNADQLRKIHISIRVGTADVLFCDSEILHLYLDALKIPHEYRVFDGVGHECDKLMV